MRYACTPAADRGFSLVEVMVALIIICVGLLGIAKLEALMLSSTGTSRTRALIALEAASLADTMHADRDYWDGTSAYWNAANGPLLLSGTETSGTTTFTGTNAPVAGGPTCLATACNAVQLADYDLSNWAGDMASVVKNSTSSINCLSANSVVSCTISIIWSENTVAANTQEAEAGAPTTFQRQTYTLAVEP